MSQLDKNTAALQSLLNTANALPSGGTLALQDKVVTPAAVTQKISADPAYGGLGKVTVVGDSNLKARNIPSGMKLFGIEGTLIRARAYCNLKIVYSGEAPHSQMWLHLVHPFFNAKGELYFTEDILCGSYFEEVVEEDDYTYYTATFTDVLIGSLCVLYDDTSNVTYSDAYTEGCAVDSILDNDLASAMALQIEVGEGDTALVEFVN